MTARGYMMPSARADWRTPRDVLDLVEQVFGGKPDLDPCGHPDAFGLAARQVWLPEHLGDEWSIAGFAAELVIGDGLLVSWASRRVFVNPPFDDLAAWTAKCANEAWSGAEVILLLPSRTDTAYWHEPLATANLLCLWRGRMKFVGAPASCPFPITLAYWGRRPAVFHAVFGARGMIVAPSPMRRAG